MSSIQQTIKLQKIPFIYSALNGMVLLKVSGEIVIIAFEKLIMKWEVVTKGCPEFPYRLEIICFRPLSH